ncbi:hypothetical protein GXP70_12265 [Paenibacillus lycopersici]|uniref:DUF3139 domain-containing protein n=1 Tax=Paenibacillus lycopersici TaxID=2704462 RepID=A0A6C0FU06_9BACL|nr:hypothetical protein [Paenibacillus lycopersici]QHT60638.1 hypothetical protein GXP70_12265 [Paenibacillus lycopersici]
MASKIGLSLIVVMIIAILATARAYLKHRAFENAFQRQLPVEVWQDGEMHDRGPIERHTHDEVVINGMHYRKQAFEFRIK